MEGLFKAWSQAVLGGRYWAVPDGGRDIQG